ncbi:sodium:proton antiporter [Coprothermobacteraceae bacterium]|nr:sodium:proton antiporter [Coprothermobacteraceae bacterium]
MVAFLMMAGVLLAGLYGILGRKNLLKIIISLSVATSGLNLMIVSVGYWGFGATAPIFLDIKPTLAVADPVPHALTLTSIVIDVAVTALALSIALWVHKYFGTFDMSKIRRLRG